MAVEDTQTDDVGYWRERAAQLQHALDSRVVIEQAKGILRERIGVGLEGAFELLRYAARSNGHKLHDLAAEIVATFETPEQIIGALAKHPDVFKAMSRDERVTQTQEFFRRLNDDIAAKGHAKKFLCECGNPHCNMMIELSAEDLLLLHSRPGYYAVVPGHELPDLERVAGGNDHYAIVEKLASVED